MTEKEIKALEEQQKAVFAERDEIFEQIRELEKKKSEILNREYELTEIIHRAKQSETSQFLGKYAKITHYNSPTYIFITKVENHSNSALASFKGPHFHDYKDSISVSWETSSSGWSSASIESLSEIEIITREEFEAAYQEFIERNTKNFFNVIDSKPKRKSATEYFYENEMFDKIMFEGDLVEENEDVCEEPDSSDVNNS